MPENLARRYLVLALATLGGVGYLPGAPGTWGTLAALPLWWALSHLGLWGYGLSATVVLLVAWWAAGPAQAYLGRDDHPAIVIDEVAGLLIALAGVPLTWPAAVLGFTFFRTLDILKPPPIRWFCRGAAGGLEVVAGLLARLALEIIMAFRLIAG